MTHDHVLRYQVHADAYSCTNRGEAYIRIQCTQIAEAGILKDKHKSGTWFILRSGINDDFSD